MNTEPSQYKAYVESKLGAGARVPIMPSWDNAHRAAGILKPDYDIGLALAADGLGLGFAFERTGLPVRVVKLGRRGNGARWEPIDKICEEELKGKKVLLFDNDAVTGRTLRRTVRELSVFSPGYVDLLLNYKCTPVTVKNFKKWRVQFNLDIIDSFAEGTRILCVEDTEEGLLVKYIKPGYLENADFAKTMTFGKKEAVCVRTSRNVPREIRKVMTLDDFTR